MALVDVWNTIEACCGTWHVAFRTTRKLRGEKSAYKRVPISDASSTMSSLVSYLENTTAYSAAWSPDSPYFSALEALLLRLSQRQVHCQTHVQRVCRARSHLPAPFSARHNSLRKDAGAAVWACKSCVDSFRSRCEGCPLRWARIASLVQYEYMWCHNDM